MDIPADVGFDYEPELPIAISQVGGRHLLFDIKVATFLRREHRICGTQTGTLPLAPSQNLFLGLPIEIMPEEAQLLVDKGVAVVVDDARAHDQAVLRCSSSDGARRADYLASLDKQARRFEKLSMQEKEQSRQRALERRAKASTRQPSSAESTTPRRRGEAASSLLDLADADEEEQQQEEEEAAASTAPTLGENSARHEPVSSQTPPDSTSEQPVSSASNYHITPATSQPLLPDVADAPRSTVQDLPASYPMYKHLHERGYFMTPGLRFGCQYNVYPGDQLRFHSHFLASAFEWDEPIDPMDVVGGGRLGTGVKKGFLLGGADPAGQVRTFSVEWAAM
ncbi:tRNA-intron endonuclease [Exophiala spinifera]|uniref:tRNA-splicing endonuclease subunit Sen34 n=1 Tax=Exophiala spinifera TaxID=91928 RepID=A0A0D1YA28_9EURO|nr:tRNA-intron endonuclease [Exophiala spinifera]KIW11806.1 tRNA-intron endonuclease [Exophiala spinifera]